MWQGIRSAGWGVAMCGAAAWFQMVMRLAHASVVMSLVMLTPTPVVAHILFGNGEQGDIVEDLVLNFVMPVIVLVVGAVAGVVLSRWLGRRAPVTADTDSPDDDS